MTTLLNDNLICLKCNTSLPKEQFFRVIRRRTYAIDCDEDGFTYYGKPTLQCSYCRSKQNKIMSDRNHIKKFNKKNKFN